MEAKEKEAKRLCFLMGKEGAIRQCLEEIGNSDTKRDRDYWSGVLIELENL